MRVSRKRKVSQVGHRLSTSLRGNRAGAHVSPQHLCNFQIDQVRSVKSLVGGKYEVADAPRCRRLK